MIIGASSSVWKKVFSEPRMNAVHAPSDAVRMSSNDPACALGLKWQDTEKCGFSNEGLNHERTGARPLPLPQRGK